MRPRPWTENLLQVAPAALYGTHCRHCDRKTFPCREVCPECHAGDNQDRITLSTRGSLATYTVIRQAPPGTDVPYVLGYVDLFADDVRVLSRVARVELDALRLGLELELELIEFGRDTDGVLVGWQFVPTTTSVDQREELV